VIPIRQVKLSEKDVMPMAFLILTPEMICPPLRPLLKEAMVPRMDIRVQENRGRRFWGN
jgi:hypothetical protein